MSFDKINNFATMIERSESPTKTGISVELESTGAAIGSTDKLAGDVIIQPGISTGMGKQAVWINRLSRTAATATTDNTRLPALGVMTEKNLTDNVATNLFEVALATLTMAAGQIVYHVCVSDGTELQSHSNNIHYAVINKGGTYTNVFTTPPTAAESLSTGTLAVALSFVEGANKVTIAATANTSLATPTIMKLYYTINCGGVQAITQL